MQYFYLSNKTSGFECKKVLSMAISVVLVMYDIAIMPSGDYILALYDIVIIKHYFASGLLHSRIPTGYCDY